LTAAPFEFVNYIEVECVKELNEHGRIKITGVIREEESRKYMELAAKEVWVSVNAISEKEEIRRFFAGILTGLRIKKEGQVSVLTIEVKTGSYLLDIDPHTRSFQEPEFMYEEMINTCMNQTGGTCSMLDQKGKAANQFFLQYRESDWTFLKRLASHAGAVMIPEDSYPEKKFYWGYRLPHAVSDLQSDGYEMEQDYEWYEKKRADGGNVRLADAVSYKVGSRWKHPDATGRCYGTDKGRDSYWRREDLYELTLIKQAQNILKKGTNGERNGLSRWIKNIRSAMTR